VNNIEARTRSAFCYAPGKAILVGEHAVVYGASAIAIPIENGVRVAITDTESHLKKQGIGPLMRGVGTFLFGEAYIGERSFGPAPIKAMLNYLVEIFSKDIEDLVIIVDGSLPPGRGLGFSAALSVAVIKAIDRYLELGIDNESLYKHANALETIFHGRPSGIDHAAVINNRPIGFRRDKDQGIHWPIHIGCDMTMVVAWAGPHDGTKNAVQMLKQRKERHHDLYENIFKGLDNLSKAMEKCLIEGSLVEVGELMNIAHGYLSAMMVSTPELDRLCSIARGRGALGAKLTGAGGGGAMIALSEDQGSKLMQAFQDAGYPCMVTTIKKTIS